MNMKEYTKELLTKYYNEAEDPKLGLSQFLYRVMSLNWSKERAISTPIKPLAEHSKELQNYYWGTPKERRMVPYDTYYARINSGWTKERALSTAVVNQSQQWRQVWEKADPTDRVNFEVFYSRMMKGTHSVVKGLYTPQRTSRAARPHSPNRQFYEANKARAQVPLSIYMTRLNSGKWDNERALTTSKLPPKAPTSALRIFFEAHPYRLVSYSVFVSRVRSLGWSKERAILTPCATKDRVEEKKSAAKTGTRKVPPAVIAYYQNHEDRAEVSRSTYLRRVQENGWSMEKALTTKLRTHHAPPTHHALHQAWFA